MHTERPDSPTIIPFRLDRRYELYHMLELKNVTALTLWWFTRHHTAFNLENGRPSQIFLLLEMIDNF